MAGPHQAPGEALNANSVPTEVVGWVESRQKAESETGGPTPFERWCWGGFLAQDQAPIYAWAGDSQLKLIMIRARAATVRPPGRGDKLGGAVRSAEPVPFGIFSLLMRVS